MLTRVSVKTPNNNPTPNIPKEAVCLLVISPYRAIAPNEPAVQRNVYPIVEIS